MTRKTIAAAAAALAALCLPAQAETEFTQLSPSIIFMGEPAPAQETEEAAEDERHPLPDVLADGERRPAGVATAAVAQDEETSALPDAPPEDAETPPAPLEESELRRGS